MRSKPQFLNFQILKNYKLQKYVMYGINLFRARIEVKNFLNNIFVGIKSYPQFA